MSSATDVVEHRAMRLSRRQMLLWGRVTLLLLLLLLWEFYARQFGDPGLISAPSQIVVALATRILPDVGVLSAIGFAVIEVAVAFVISAVVGVVLGIAIGWSQVGRRGVLPIVLLIYAVPQVILLPLFVMGFGVGPFCKILFGFTHGVFPVLLNVAAGMRQTNLILVRGAQTMGASRVALARHVYLPAMVSSLFAGLRLSMTLCMLGVILAELYVSTTGIGHFTTLFAQDFDPAPLFALVAILAGVAIAMNQTVRIAGRRLTRWRN
jgi:ABC-type nitrate/sulfonate/bicarbonate transport system permease component